MPADDQLFLEQILGGLVSGRVPGEGQPHLARQAADPVELVEIEAHRAGIAEPREQHAALHERDREAILRRRIGDEVGGGEAAGRRHVLHDDARIACDVRSEVARHEPRQGVVAAAHGRPADEVDLLPGEEARRRRLGQLRPAPGTIVPVIASAAASTAQRRRAAIAVMTAARSAAAGRPRPIRHSPAWPRRRARDTPPAPATRWRRRCARAGAGRPARTGCACDHIAGLAP